MKNVQKYQLCCSPLMSTLFIVLACHWCLQKNIFGWGAFSKIVPALSKGFRLYFANFLITYLGALFMLLGNF